LRNKCNHEFGNPTDGSRCDSAVVDHQSRGEIPLPLRDREDGCCIYFSKTIKAGLSSNRRSATRNKVAHTRSLNQPRRHDFPLFGDFIPLTADLIQPPLIAGSSAIDRSNERKVFISQATASEVVSL
jgi:hypothetical protein